MSAAPARQPQRRPVPPEILRVIEALARVREERDYRAAQEKAA